MSETAVWFDLDGTLLQHERTFDAFVRDALVASGVVNPPEQAHDVFAERIFGALERCEDDPIERAFEAVDAQLGIDVDTAAAADAYREIEVDGTTLADGARETIDAAAERAAAVGVLSNGEGDLQRAKLDAHDLADAFDAVVISNEVGARKPDPEIFATAADRLSANGVDAAEHVFVADEYETDIGPAEQAGWSAIHVRNDEGPSGSVNRVGSLGTLLL
ncbi:HAD-superfamily hydrolase [Salinarchaeum sp. Harcht-Bsk1]|uniref:HAD family hydrolase n=1 Tax=Salinarchaeum sp. Harcht-Bsk1 TaxID=1333523 RepID=UPI00034239BA|nr:HAD family hydrolase [Salinarchaeum sp. Harcht-Bsk1]AGN01730.1 HAD-superfamily hydrolase [Salinarchaeum sp. Harcht-Bsk1]